MENIILEKINKGNGQIFNADDIKKIDDNVDKIQNAFNNLPTSSTVISSSINGNIRIDGNETTVYNHTTVDDHISNVDIHVTSDLKTNLNNLTTEIKNARNGEIDLNTRLNKLNMNQQSKNYSELKTLVNNNQLVAGMQYVLTDYKTKYLQPNTNVIKEMNAERLVLTANSINSFELICSSLDYLKDIIYYDFNNNICEDNTTTRNGFILRRIDTKLNVDIPGDWRTMTWARYGVDQNQFLIGSTLTNFEIWTNGSAKLNTIYKSGTFLYIAKNTNTPTSANDPNVFELVFSSIDCGLFVTKANFRMPFTFSGSQVYLKNTQTYIEYPTVDTTKCSNLTFLGFGALDYSAYKILHNNVFVHKTFYNQYLHNVFGHNFKDNTFAGDVNNNTIGNNFFGNLILGSFNANDIGSTFYNNYAYDFNNNRVGSACNTNLFINCLNSDLGNMFYNNTALNGFTNNVFLCGVNNNIFGRNKQNLLIKMLSHKDLSNTTALENRTYTTNIEARSDGKYVYWNLDSSNAPQYTLIS